MSIMRPAVKPERVAFVGTERPLSREFLRELTARCPTVCCAEPATAGAVGVHGLPPDGQSPPVPVLALLTWMDVVADGDGASRWMLKQLAALEHAAGAPREVFLCAVPYGSYFGDGGWQHEFLSPAGDGAAAARAGGSVEQVAGALRQAGAAVTTLFTPMVLWNGADESAGHPSAAQKVLRVARCLGEEVVSKAPAYFSQYALKVLWPGPEYVNCASWSDIVETLLSTVGDAGCRQGEEERPLHLSSLISWSDFADAAAGDMVKIGRARDILECNALDDTFNELLFSEPGIRSGAVTYVEAAHLTRTVSATRLKEAIAGAAGAPRQPWEDSYVLVRRIDADLDIDLPIEHLTIALPEDAPRTVKYYCGGAGPPVIIVIPLGVDPAYFAQMLTPVTACHRVIMWQASGATSELVARDIADLRELFAREDIDAFHLLTVCGGMRLVARLAVECARQVKSLVLIAPFLDTRDEQTEGYRSLARFWERFAVSRGSTDERAEQARLAWREQLMSAPASKLDQYGSRATMRSPLRYHPTGFTSKGAEELYADAGLFVRLLGMARADDTAETVQLTRQDIVSYQGPVLVIAGTADALVGYTSVRRRCEEQTRWTLATVVGGNHYAFLEHGPLFGRLLVQFLADGPLLPPAAGRVTGTRLRISSPRLAAVLDGEIAQLETAT